MGVTPEAFNKLPGERKIIYISAVLGIILFAAWLSNRKQPAAVSESQGGDGGQIDGGGGFDYYDRQAEIDAAKEVSLASIAHSAALQFSVLTNAISHDIGGSGSGKSGGGGLSIGGFSIGGSGGSQSNSFYDLETGGSFEAGFSATGLSADEFQMALQQSAALTNQAALSQQRAYDYATDKINRFKPLPKPRGAPRGKHLERAEDGQYYWVPDGQTLAGGAA